MTAALLLQHDAGVTTLTLSRPERGNALAPDLVEALLAAATQACADSHVHTLVLRGAGKHFCTGLDLSDLASSSDADWLHRLVRIETLLALLWHAPLRTVTVAQGRTWGAGADLFACCELRVAAADTSFRFPGAQFAVVLGTRRLAERIGTDAARRLVIDGAELSAAAAMDAGLVSQTNDGSLLEFPSPKVSAPTAAAIRAASRSDHRDADLAALVRSAAEPGLRERMLAYRARSSAKA